MINTAEPPYQILYIDDEPQNLMLFKATFRRFYPIITANGAQEALEIMETTPCQIIISDQRMPYMSGTELLEAIKQKYPNTIRMIMTAFSDTQAMLDSINRGKIYHYITKPWDSNELKSIIDNAIESYDLKTTNQSLLLEKNNLLVKAEKQKKENILAQYEILKNQVNPHFLFNCLNTLYSLLGDQADAKAFVTKMSKVYRYLLTFRNQSSIELEEELKFIDDYIYLQKIRFGDSLIFELNVPDHYHEYFLPPLSIQILIENAIKHNVIAQNKPLKIHISVDEEDFLVVQNNFQPRLEKADSTGIGISNIRDRFNFMTERKPTYEQNAEAFIAKIPLLD
ncbi:MAG: histidine kinase [Bacteroidota bacterium]